MALGDGIRRNIATVSQEERDRFLAALLALQQKLYPDNVSYWFKQDQIHANTHVHFCPAFLPWHRELVNRLEGLLQEVDPQLSLHYWDFTQDPRNAPDGQGGFVNLFSPVLPFMGNAQGDMGEPFLSAGFYGGPGPYRDDPGGNPSDPPQSITRQVGVNGPLISVADQTTALQALDFVAFDNEMEGSGVNVHAQAHNYIGGTLLDPHTSFRDPVAYLLHSNIDRLFAMWQRTPGHPERVDPAQVYKAQSSGQNGFEFTKGGDRTTIDPPGVPHEPCDDDVTACLEPWWGILSPLEPWAGPGDVAQAPEPNSATGFIKNVGTVRPWAPPDNQQVFKDSRDPTVVFPPSYDTVPHSAYIIRELDIFSDTEIQNQTAYPGAMLLIYDGFTPNELGGNPPPPPALKLTLDAIGGADASPYISIAAGPALTEGGGPDVPQRITYSLDLSFIDASLFNTFLDTRQVALQATLGANVTDSGFELTKKPNPYMLDGDTYWLSTDVRAFKLLPQQSVQGSSTVLADPASDPNAPLTYINALLTEFRGKSDINNDPSHPFEQLSQDETASWLEQLQTIGSTPVFNFAVAKVRYRANTTPATGVQVFFRTFATMRSALDYTYVAPSPPSINYTRSGSWPNAVPLLGLIDGEVASIPYFAVPRIDSTAQAMTQQQLDTPNIQPIAADAGQEAVMFFGCWLDFNQPTNRFPFSPSGVGPYTSGAQPIPALINGLHQCLVAEILFEPGGGADPIPSGSNPATSDRLAQRNLAIDNSSNPGGPASHTVAHSFMLRPSKSLPESARAGIQAALAERLPIDELMIRWNDLPRDTKATLYLPEWNADTVLQLAAMRQHPNVLHKVDAHTLSIDLADLTFVPIPRSASQTNAGLITLVLPAGVHAGQVFHADFHQIDALRRRIDGSFRLTVPVGDDAAILPEEIRRLAFLRYVAQKRPVGNRWQPIFARWIELLAGKVGGLGGDPDQVPPSLTDPQGGGAPSPGATDCVTGKVRCVLYDCFGDFEGFVLTTCDGEHRFAIREQAIERLVHRACCGRERLTVCFDRRTRRITALQACCF
jgi:Common central domain of tyrosinase